MRTLKWWILLVCCLAWGSVATAGPAAKDTQPAAQAKSKSGSATPPKQIPKAANHSKSKVLVVGAEIPDEYKLNMLIRTTIIAVSQANKTGNYSVLRDLGSPNFQTANSVAKLTEIFAGQRNAQLDLSPVLFFQPKLVRKPQIDANGMLRLTGFFDTKPLQVTFDLAFEFVQNDWRHFALGVGTHQTNQTAGAAPAPRQKE